MIYGNQAKKRLCGVGLLTWLSRLKFLGYGSGSPQKFPGSVVIGDFRYCQSVKVIESFQVSFLWCVMLLRRSCVLQLSVITPCRWRRYKIIVD